MRKILESFAIRVISGGVVLLATIYWIIPLVARPVPKPAQVLRVSLGGAPQMLDPARAQSAPEATIDGQITEPLMRSTPDLKDVQPLAAERMDVSADGLTYTFHLRPLRYADGQRVQAGDFVYAWSRILDPRLASSSARLFAPAIRGGGSLASLDPAKDASKIDESLRSVGLQAPDPATFVVTLAQPQSYFKWLATLWQGAPLRREVVDHQGSDSWGTLSAGGIASLITNGPYRVAEFVDRDRVVLVPNPSYAGVNRPTLARIVAYTNLDETAAWSGYQKGTLDAVSPPADVLGAVKDSKELHRVPRLGLYWVVFNTQKPPFDNQRVREAFAESIDRGAYASSVWKGSAQPAAGPVPQGVDGYQSHPPSAQGLDSSRARAALGASGVSPDVLGSVRLSVRSGSTLDRVSGEFLRQQWHRNLAVDVGVDSVDPKLLGQKLRGGDFQVQVLGGWPADYPDQQDWFHIFRSTDGGNFSRYHSARYDELIKAAEAESGAGARETLYAQAADLLVHDAPVAFLCQPVQSWMIRPSVTGYHLTSLDDPGLPGSRFASGIRIK